MQKVWNNIPGYTKIQFCSAFVIGLLVHMYIMANGFINHDSPMIQTYYNWAYGFGGRWFGIVPDMISGSFNLMWINSLLAVIYISISTCLIGACLEIRRTSLVLLLSGLVVSFPTVACGLSYRFTADGIFFTVLLVCLAIFLVRRFKYGFIFGIIPLLFSLATYQAYVGFFAGIMVLMLIRDILNDQKIKSVLINGFKYLFTLIVGLVIYIISIKLPSSDNTAAYLDINTFGGFTLQSIPENFIFSYKNFFEIFFRNSLYIHQDYMQSGRIYQLLFAIAAIAILVLLIYLIINKKIYSGKPRLILLLILIALIPPACNAISILAPDSLYILMQYSLVLLFAFILMILDVVADTEKMGISFIRSKIIPLCSWFLIVFCFVITVNYALYSNVFYTKMDIVNKQGYSFSTNLVGRIQDENFYSGDKQIVLFGEVPQSSALGYFETMHAIPLGDIPNMYSYPAYLTTYAGLDNPISHSRSYVPAELADSTEGMQLVQDMPSYPAQGSIAEVEGLIVVKFSD